MTNHEAGIGTSAGAAGYAQPFSKRRTSRTRKRCARSRCSACTRATSQQIATVAANPAHQQWAERVEETVRTEVAEQVNEIAAENDSAPPNDRNELRRYAAALLINDEPKSDTAADELVGLEPETIRLLADAGDDAASPLGVRLARALASGDNELEAEYAAVCDEPLPAD